MSRAPVGAATQVDTRRQRKRSERQPAATLGRLTKWLIYQTRRVAPCSVVKYFQCHPMRMNPVSPLTVQTGKAIFLPSFFLKNLPLTLTLSQSSKVEAGDDVIIQNIASVVQQRFSVGSERCLNCSGGIGGKAVSKTKESV